MYADTWSSPRGEPPRGRAHLQGQNEARSHVACRPRCPESPCPAGQGLQKAQHRLLCIPGQVRGEVLCRSSGLQGPRY